MCIFRMMELTGGSITIDGVDISTLPRNEIRSRIVGVPQDAYLMIGSVRFNADPQQAATDDAIITALKAVKLWDVISEKGGLDADVDEVHLSHGQKQLFCLARAMLRPSKILILDEATSRFVLSSPLALYPKFLSISEGKSKRSAAGRNGRSIIFFFFSFHELTLSVCVQRRRQDGQDHAARHPQEVLGPHNHRCGAQARDDPRL